MPETYHAIHRGARISPRKTRLVANLIRGLKVPRALDILAFTDKRAASFVSKVLKSAVANAERNEAVTADNLVVSAVLVNEGPRMKRIFPRPRGVAFPINRPSCHIRVEVSEPPQAVTAPGSPETT